MVLPFLYQQSHFSGNYCDITGKIYITNKIEEDTYIAYIGPWKMYPWKYSMKNDGIERTFMIYLPYKSTISNILHNMY